jgi:peptide/nickel transport system permease protein
MDGSILEYAIVSKIVEAMKSTITNINDMPATNPVHVGELRRVMRVMFSRKIVIFGTVVIAIAVIVAIFAPLIAPYNPYNTKLTESLQQPGSQHLLGTDALGRDTLSRVIYGARTSLLVGLVSILIAATLGMMLGLTAGFYGGVIQSIIMRLVDALMSIPLMLMALMIAALMGGGLTNIMVAIGVGLTATYARLMFGQVLSVKEMDYISAARVIGLSEFAIMMKHVFVNCFPTMIVFITTQMGFAILLESGLSFIGVGIAPPGASWGSMVNDGYKYILDLPILSIAPGVAIMLVVFAFNMVGDGLRDALDPRLRGNI